MSILRYFMAIELYSISRFWKNSSLFRAHTKGTLEGLKILPKWGPNNFKNIGFTGVKITSLIARVNQKLSMIERKITSLRRKRADARGTDFLKCLNTKLPLKSNFLRNRPLCCFISNDTSFALYVLRQSYSVTNTKMFIWCLKTLFLKFYCSFL